MAERDADAFVDNAADPEQVKIGRRKIRAAEQRRRDTLARLMHTTDGAEHLAARIVDAGIFLSSFTLEPLEMAFQEGRRNEGLKLIAELVHADRDRAIAIILKALTHEIPTQST